VCVYACVRVLPRLCLHGMSLVQRLCLYRLSNLCSIYPLQSILCLYRPRNQCSMPTVNVETLNPKAKSQKPLSGTSLA
jgi:hypothetical protein